MKNTLILSLIAVILVRCGQSEQIPDVSGIPMPVTVYRSEQDLFSHDSTQAAAGLSLLHQKDPVFSEFLQHQILDIPENIDAAQRIAFIGSYLKQYEPVFKESATTFKEFKPIEDEILLAFRLAKHYLGNRFKAPKKLITYIGPFNDWSNILSPNGDVYIGLQYHLDTLSTFYQHPLFKEHYPDYITRRFIPENIAVRTAENVMLDLYPETTEERTLIQLMIEKGKRLYLLEKLLPNKPKHLLIGYTKNQYDACMQQQAQIWNMFLHDDRLQTMNITNIRSYIGDSPKTQELAEDAPGNLGSFTGWQILRHYMKKFPETTIHEMMMLSAEEILQKAKYKP